jgi:hypothetical protein
VDLSGPALPGKLADQEPSGAENGVQSPVVPGIVAVGVTIGTVVSVSTAVSVGAVSVGPASVSVGVALATSLAATLALEAEPPWGWATKKINAPAATRIPTATRARAIGIMELRGAPYGWP